MDYAGLLKKVPNQLKDVTNFQTAGSKINGKISIGCGLAEKTGEEALKLAVTGKALLITGKTITNLGMDKVIVSSLENAGFEIEVFDDVEPEPHIETAQKLQDIVKSDKFNVVIGLGGGSALDIAKAGAISGTNDKDIIEYMHGTPIDNESLPLILIPTTSGTGSEVSPFIVLSKGDKKLFISTPYAYPTVAIVDPLLTVTKPPKVTAFTGLDALTHGVEGYIAKPSPFSEALTLKCVEYVFKYLEKAFLNGEDIEARYYMAFASVMGMISYSQGGGLYAHSCSYILTTGKGLSHGIGCGVTLPYTLMYNIDYIKAHLNKFARVVDCDLSGTEDDIALRMVEKFYSLLGKVGMSTSIKELGVAEEEVAAFADQLVNKYYRVKNPRAMSLEEGNKFAEMLWRGELSRI